MNILFFSPNSNIIEHSIPESLLMKELLKNRDNVIYRVFCDTLFDSFCSSMECLNLNIKDSVDKKKLICKQCQKTSQAINQSIGIRALPISNYISKEKNWEINNYIDNLGYEKFSFDSDDYLSQDLKKKALYETILKFKLKDLNLDKEQFDYYKTKLKVSLLSYFSAINLSKEFDFDILVVYSPQYEINNFFCEGINSTKKIKTYFIEGSENVYLKHSGLRIWDWNENKLVSPVKSKWEDLKKLNLPYFSNNIVNKHIRELHKASSLHVYSSKKTKSFKFENNFSTEKFRKTFLLSMSSTDESYAAFIVKAFPESKYNSKVFKDQIEWVIHTINFLRREKSMGLLLEYTLENLKIKEKAKFLQLTSNYLQF